MLPLQYSVLPHKKPMTEVLSMILLLIIIKVAEISNTYD